MPHEQALLGIFFSPFLPALLGGIGMGALVFALAIRWDVNRFFVHPPWVFVGLSVICTSLLAAFMVVL